MIRPAEPEDLSACLELLSRFSNGILELGAKTFVCEQKGRLVGFVICKVLDSRLPLDIVSRIGQIDTIVVDKTLNNYRFIFYSLF